MPFQHRMKRKLAYKNSKLFKKLQVLINEITALELMYTPPNLQELKTRDEYIDTLSLFVKHKEQSSVPLTRVTLVNSIVNLLHASQQPGVLDRFTCKRGSFQLVLRLLELSLRGFKSIFFPFLGTFVLASNILSKLLNSVLLRFLTSYRYIKDGYSRTVHQQSKEQLSIWLKSKTIKKKSWYQVWCSS